MSNYDAKFILENSDLLIKEDCVIVEDTLYERCKFNELFKKEDYANSDTETYYLNDDSHIYRVFLSTDDYDYVTDSNLIKKLNEIF